MKHLKKLFILSLFFLCYACFDQEDDVTIYKSGKIELFTTIEITEESADIDDVKEEVDSKIELLEKAGWNVSHKWIRKSKPYKIEFTASNTLNKLYEYQKETEGESPSGVYITKKFSDKEYVVTFDLMKDANNRILNLSKNSLSFFSIDENEKLKELRRIKSEKNYYVFLD
jgi:hypothetical protein